MAINERVIHIELDSVHEMNRLLSNASNSINQIARKVNETGSVYAPNLEDIRARQEETWLQQKEVLRRLNKVIDITK